MNETVFELDWDLILSGNQLSPVSRVIVPRDNIADFLKACDNHGHITWTSGSMPTTWEKTSFCYPFYSFAFYRKGVKNLPHYILYYSSLSSDKLTGREGPAAPCYQYHDVCIHTENHSLMSLI